MFCVCGRGEGRKERWATIVHEPAKLKGTRRESKDFHQHKTREGLSYRDGKPGVHLQITIMTNRRCFISTKHPIRSETQGREGALQAPRPPQPLIPVPYKDGKQANPSGTLSIHTRGGEAENPPPGIHTQQTNQLEGRRVLGDHGIIRRHDSITLSLSNSARPSHPRK